MSLPNLVGLCTPNEQPGASRSSTESASARCLKVLSQAYDADLAVEDGGGTIGTQALRLHRDAGELVNGVLEQCWCCIRVCRFLQQEQVLPQETGSEALSVFAKKWPTFDTQIKGYTDDIKMVNCRLAEDKQPHCFPIFCIPFDGSYTVPELANSLDSDQSFGYITERLANCRENHTLCRSATDWYPTRSIAIRQDDSPKKMHLNLIETANEVMTGPYVTLSHCWGQGQPLRLMTNHLDQFKRSIPFESIQPLHQDAITVVRRLDIQYLWIDSLCIIQDSVEDWRYESSLMGYVYQKGLFNIAAASASDGSGRLFGSRDPHLIGPDVLYTPRSNSGEHLLWYEGGGHLDFSANMLFEQSPLYSRAWVQQETLLSNRAVAFTKEQIHFRCAEEISCEILPVNHPLLQESSLSYDLVEVRKMLASMKSLKREDCPVAWREIIRSYFGTDITRDSDRLIAMSAIARYFWDLRKSKYCAGLWEDTFLDDMVWVVSQPEQRPDNYVAPTWSWASISRVCGSPSRLCIMESECKAPISRILHIWTDPCGQDEFGEIKNGWVEIRAPVYYMGQKDKHGLESALVERYGWANWLVQPWCEVDMDHWGLEDEIPLHIFAVPLQAGSSDAQEDKNALRWSVSILLLVPVTPAEGVYKRVGFCHFVVSSPAATLTSAGINHANTTKSRGLLWQPELPYVNRSSHRGISAHEGSEPARFLARMERRNEDIPSHETYANGWHRIRII